jgi:hypothetical protein
MIATVSVRMTTVCAGALIKTLVRGQSKNAGRQPRIAYVNEEAYFLLKNDFMKYVVNRELPFRHMRVIGVPIVPADIGYDQVVIEWDFD